MVYPKVGATKGACTSGLAWTCAGYGIGMFWMSQAMANAGVPPAQIWIVALAIGAFLATKAL